MGKVIDSFDAHRIGRPLSESPVGQRAVLHSTLLARADRELLAAMGVSEECELTVCRQGEPCIVRVGTTRVGISRALARDIWVQECSESALHTAV